MVHKIEDKDVVSTIGIRNMILYVPLFLFAKFHFLPIFVSIMFEKSLTASHGNLWGHTTTPPPQK